MLSLAPLGVPLLLRTAAQAAVSLQAEENFKFSSELPFLKVFSAFGSVPYRLAALDKMKDGLVARGKDFRSRAGADRGSRNWGRTAAGAGG